MFMKIKLNNKYMTFINFIKLQIKNLKALKSKNKIFKISSRRRQMRQTPAASEPQTPNETDSGSLRAADAK
jgi:hypothetical protein